MGLPSSESLSASDNFDEVFDNGSDKDHAGV